MCNPIVAAGLAVASTLLGTVSRVNTERYQARVADNAAAMQRQQAGLLAARQASETGRLLARQRAAFAAAGIGGGGSPLDIGFDVAQEGRIEERQRLYEGELGAVQNEASARLHRYNQGVDLLLGLTSAGSQLLSLSGSAKSVSGTPKGSKAAG